MIPKIIHLVALPPMDMSAADETIQKISVSNPDYEIKVHTKPLSNFPFENMPISGPSGLCNLIRMDVLRRFGGWYFDLDVAVECNLQTLEKRLGLGNNLAISFFKQEGNVCTFTSCCPADWKGWDKLVPYIQAHPSSNKGHYCSRVMGRLVREKPYFCDRIPNDFLFSNKWLNHRPGLDDHIELPLID